MNNYTEEHVKDMLNMNSEFYNVEADKLREVIDTLKKENETLQKLLDETEAKLEEITEASAIVLTESLRYQEVLNTIAKLGPASPGDKKHKIAKDALGDLEHD